MNHEESGGNLKIETVVFKLLPEFGLMVMLSVNGFLPFVMTRCDIYIRAAGSRMVLRRC